MRNEKAKSDPTPQTPFRYDSEQERKRMKGGQTERINLITQSRKGRPLYAATNKHFNGRLVILDK